MFNFKTNNKGIALIMVLGTLMVVLVLTGAILGIISSQSRLTQHQVSRIQAYYAAMAGVNLALENLRLGNWQSTGSYSGTLCRSGCNVNEPDLPGSVQRVEITVGEPINGRRMVTAKTVYSTP